MDKTPEIAAGFAQDVDLAEIGQPMFIKVAGREIVVMDAEPFRAMQDKAAAWDGQWAVRPTEQHFRHYYKAKENTNAG